MRGVTVWKGSRSEEKKIVESAPEMTMLAPTRIIADGIVDVICRRTPPASIESQGEMAWKLKPQLSESVPAHRKAWV